MVTVFTEIFPICISSDWFGMLNKNGSVLQSSLSKALHPLLWVSVRTIVDANLKYENEKPWQTNSYEMDLKKLNWQFFIFLQFTPLGSATYVCVVGYKP